MHRCFFNCTFVFVLQITCMFVKHKEFRWTLLTIYTTNINLNFLTVIITWINNNSNTGTAWAADAKTLSLFYRLPLTITSSSIYKINNIYANPSHLYSTPQKMSWVPTEWFIVRHFLTIKKKFNFLFKSIGVIKNKHFAIYWF